MNNERPPRMVFVQVIDGVGEIDVPHGGEVTAFGVIPPTSTAKYDIGGFDTDGFLLYFEQNVVGNLQAEARAHIWGQHNVVISNAVDGRYKVKLWFKN